MNVERIPEWARCAGSLLLGLIVAALISWAQHGAMGTATVVAGIATSVAYALVAP